MYFMLLAASNSKEDRGIRIDDKIRQDEIYLFKVRYNQQIAVAT